MPWPQIYTKSLEYKYITTFLFALGNGTTQGHFSREGCQWLVLKALFVFTTLQVQDLRDQKGDLKRGRSTVPLVLGDMVARWTIALPVMMWSFFCPWFLGTPSLEYLFPRLLGGSLSARVLLRRKREADKLSRRL